jgi:hypothetical protein
MTSQQQAQALLEEFWREREEKNFSPKAPGIVPEQLPDNRKLADA